MKIDSCSVPVNVWLIFTQSKQKETCIQAPDSVLLHYQINLQWVWSLPSALEGLTLGISPIIIAPVLVEQEQPFLSGHAAGRAHACFNALPLLLEFLIIFDLAFLFWTRSTNYVAGLASYRWLYIGKYIPGNVKESSCTTNFFSITTHPMKESVEQDPIDKILLCLTYRQSESEVEAYLLWALCSQL